MRSLAICALSNTTLSELSCAVLSASFWSRMSLELPPPVKSLELPPPVKSLERPSPAMSPELLSPAVSLLPLKMSEEVALSREHVDCV